MESISLFADPPGDRRRSHSTRAQTLMTVQSRINSRRPARALTDPLSPSEDLVTRAFWPVLITAAAALLVACESSTISSPRVPGAATLALSASRPSCVITLPAPVDRPLPAVREVTRELNEAFANPTSTANCGTLQGIGARMNRLVAVLDQPTGAQNLDAACGIASGLANELAALVKTGQLNPVVTHPPEASPNVVENMSFIASQFCVNARG